MSEPPSAVDSFWGRVDKTSECWLWLGALNSNGYGTLRFERRHVYAHRLSYELHVGPIPAGLEIDHLCRVRSCVNPAHLEAVTHVENLRRSDTLWAVLARTGKCKEGHERTPENTTVEKRGKTVCLICKRANWRAWYREKKAAAGETVAVANGQKTECKNGHPFDEANTYIIPSTGTRSCRACSAANQRRRAVR